MTISVLFQHKLYLSLYFPFTLLLSIVVTVTSRMKSSSHIVSGIKWHCSWHVTWKYGEITACSLHGSAYAMLLTHLINQALVNKWRACCQGKSESVVAAATARNKSIVAQNLGVRLTRSWRT